VTRPLVVACAALAGDLRAILDQLDLADDVDTTYLPAPLHNRPERIVPALAEAIVDAGDRRVLIGYGDCGTGGGIDSFISEQRTAGVEMSRLPGDHCYEFFAGASLFAELHAEEPGTFYLTDFLAKHFDALVWQGLGLDRAPELRDSYFGNYRRLVLLSQTEDPLLVEAARSAAEQLGLAFEHVPVGREGLARPVAVVVAGRAA